MSLSTISVRIISDAICPFCYLGYKKLLAGQSLFQQTHPSANFSIKFEPFLLDPTLTEDKPVDKRERYNEKFGAERMKPMEAAMIERGKPWGINFSYGGKLRQTTNAHRLLELAFARGGELQQRDLHERLFKAYFEEEKDIGDFEVLGDAAVQAGMGSAQEIKTFLQGDELRAEVKEHIRDAQLLGVTGVPFFIINEKYAISGAQEPDAFAEVFEKVIAE